MNLENPTHYPASMSGPRERILPEECADCRANATAECVNCFHPLCAECSVSCAACPGDEVWCAPCAIKRGVFQLLNGQWRCEECAGELEEESEIEEARR